MCLLVLETGTVVVDIPNKTGQQVYNKCTSKVWSTVDAKKIQRNLGNDCSDTLGSTQTRVKCIDSTFLKLAPQYH